MMAETLRQEHRTDTVLSELEDDELLERMRLEDDPDAYRILVERHVDRAYGLALRMLGNPSDAEDVAQEALVKTWVHRQSWQQGRAKFSTWLHRVVFNRCIDIQRAHRETCIDDVPDPKDKKPDSVHTIHCQQIQDQLEKALATVPLQQRIALTLSYFEDMKNAEIALIMETTVQAVESLLKRGRQNLRTRLRRSERDILNFFADC